MLLLRDVKIFSEVNLQYNCITSALHKLMYYICITLALYELDFASRFPPRPLEAWWLGDPVAQKLGEDLALDIEWLADAMRTNAGLVGL